MDRAHLVAMSGTLAHRGPDDRGYYFDEKGGVGLAHNRLSIIDLSSAGHQPMISEDGKIVLVYNGELYNFQELRKELESLGHRFISKTDSEVVLRSYMQWGKSCLKRFCGMFAFAIYESHPCERSLARQRTSLPASYHSFPASRLFIARDPMGMKPLYYSELPNMGGFFFASEIKAFLALPKFKALMNRTSLSQFLEFGYVFDEYETSLQGVKKLPPGHSLVVVNGNMEKPVPFFTPPMPIQGYNPSLQEREKELYKTLSEVVSQHLIADVPVGLLLSGGLDSSITASLAARQARVMTISMGFADSKIDERSFARMVARHINSDHIEVTINPGEVTENLEDVVWYFDDLFSDWGMVSTRLLYKKCREKGIKVVLVGEGSDEIFGGYPVFEAYQNESMPMAWKLFLLYRRYAGRRYGSQFIRFHSIMSDYLKQSNGSLFHAVRLFESRNQLPNNYVMKVDKASMSVSVEARAPFLDRRITELAYQIPQDHLLHEGTNKYLLRSMAESHDLLPLEITRRPKYGASIASSWMDESQEFRSYAQKVILDKKSWVDELNLRRAMVDYFSGKRQGYALPHAISIFSNLAWRLLLLNLWARKYLR